MTTQMIPPDPLPTDQPALDSPAKRGITRALLCILLVALFLLFFKSSDVLQLLGLAIAFLSINLFEPVFSVIDRADPFVWHILVKAGSGLRHIISFHIPGIGRGIKMRSHFIIPVVCVIVVVYLLFHSAVSDAASSFNDFSCLRTSVPIPSAICNSGVGVTALPNGVRIGLITSAEQGPFDLSSLNGQERQVEAAIFQEDVAACSSSHITLAVVTLLSRTIEDPSGSVANGLDDLRGAYLAQHDYNATKAKYNLAEHNGRPFVSLCLVLANLGTLVTADQTSGSDLYSVPQVVQQLVQYNRHDPTFRGIVGFPYSSQVEEGISEFTTHWWGKLLLPIVSPSATSYKLSNIPNFYRVSPVDSKQATAMALFACGTLLKDNPKASVAIFTNSDSYSSSLSNKFTQSISDCVDAAHRHYEQYQNGNAISIQRAAQDAVQKNYSFIFFPGYEEDLDTLQAQIQQSIQQNPKAQFTILGGDGLTDIVNPNHNTFVTTYATVYAMPLDNNDEPSMQFLKEYTKQKFPLPYLAASVPGYTLLSQDVMRAYNATEAFTSTLENLAGRNLDATQENITKALESITFSGIGGQIAFQGDAPNSGIISDPQYTTVYIMCTSRNNAISLVATYDGNNLVLTKNLCLPTTSP